MNQAEQARLREDIDVYPDIDSYPDEYEQWALGIAERVGNLLDALDAARAEVARLEEALKQARADVGGTASGLRLVKPSRLVMDTAASQLEEAYVRIHAVLTATTPEERV